ncbi:hypothetical protein HanRHA438_Chr17g0791721 [Helianthus annuus]|nr:hypothetical protein HanRHA438_Chr17g0791721 [Helianthus annuus]
MHSGKTLWVFVGSGLTKSSARWKVMRPNFFSYLYVLGYMFGSAICFGSGQTIITTNKTK